MGKAKYPYKNWFENIWKHGLWVCFQCRPPPSRSWTTLNFQFNNVDSRSVISILLYRIGDRLSSKWKGTLGKNALIRINFKILEMLILADFSMLWKGTPPPSKSRIWTPLNFVKKWGVFAYQLLECSIFKILRHVNIIDTLTSFSTCSWVIFRMHYFTSEHNYKIDLLNFIMVMFISIQLRNLVMFWNSNIM